MPPRATTTSGQFRTADCRPRRQLPPPERHPLEEYGSLEPQVQPENLWALPLDARQPPPLTDYDGGQTPQPRYDTPYEEPAPPRRMREPRSYGKYIRLGLIAMLVLGAVTMLYWQRSNIAGIAGSVASLFRSAPPAPREAQTPSRPKISDRLGQPTQPQPGVAGGAARGALRGGSGRSAGQALHRHRGLAHRDQARPPRAARPSLRCAPTSKSPSAR